VVGWPPPEGLVTGPSTREARTYEASEVDLPPEAVNIPELMRALLRAYPPLLRDAGTGGTVVLRFRVLEDGRVDAGAVTVLHSAHEALAAPTVRWLPVLHFRPARVRGRPVRAWVELPVTYEMRGSPSTRASVRPGP
jgi:TonB family protein